VWNRGGVKEPKVSLASAAPEWTFNRVMDVIEWVNGKVNCHFGSHHFEPAKNIVNVNLCTRPRCSAYRVTNIKENPRT
jgi:hypothetical protein